MKARAIVKISICSVVALLLSGILVAGLCLPLGDWFPRLSFGSFYYPDEASYTVGGGSVTGALRCIEVDWASGSVCIEPVDGEEIIVSEDLAYTGGNEASRLRFRLRDGVLTVHARKNGWFALGKSKRLRIGIPRGQLAALDSLSVDVASAEVLLRELTVRQAEIDSASGALTVQGGMYGFLDFDSASGGCRVEAATVTSFEMDTASGDACLDGNFQTADFGSASGSLTLRSGTVLREVEFDSASGDCDLTVPADAGFTAELDSASGDLNVEGFQGQVHRDTFTCGDGRWEYSFDTASGDVFIRAGAE